MTIHHPDLDRRTVLRTALATTAGLAGCLDTGTSNQSHPIRDASVEGTSLVVTLDDGSSVDHLTVIQPDGEAFASRSIPAGATRETIDLGTQYPPGEYTIRALDSEKTVDEQTLEIRPELEITDLKLARNHPDEMYKGAGEPAIRAEAIIIVKNTGTGPGVITKLLFEGDLPKPTRKGEERSWIYNPSSEPADDRPEVIVPPNETKQLYSDSRPFTSASSNVSCSPQGNRGTFSLIVHPRIGEPIRERYEVEYTGKELINCEIAVSEVDQ